LSLVLMTISLLLLADMTGFIPDRTQAMLEARKSMSESLAIQFTAAVERKDLDSIRNILKSIVERSEDVRSAAIRIKNGQLLAMAGDHLAHWQAPPDGRSTTTHVQVPIYNGETPWATVELRFASLWVDDLLSGFRNSFTGLLVFISLTGFAGYFFLMKRTLRELNPSEVIPSRVRAAFDVLKEGVFILDDKEQVVMANDSFAQLVGKTPEQLIGYKGSELGWREDRQQKNRVPLPWLTVLQTGENQFGKSLILENVETGSRQLSANASPVLDNKGKARGVLVTLVDVTEIEETNIELKNTLNALQSSSEKIQAKSQELEFFAAHDPLTTSLNRRELNKRFEILFADAQQKGTDLSCIIVDIDNFKLVNDKFGHATGDEVIKTVADTLKFHSRHEDLVGRYGGEEFCIVITGHSIKTVYKIADRMRLAIKKETSTGMQITASFGIKAIGPDVHSPEDMITQADKAMYAAKESGRDRVICWGDDQFTTEFDGGGIVQSVEENSSNLPHQLQTTLSDRDENDSPLYAAAEVELLASRIRELEGLAEKRSQEIRHFTIYDQMTGLPSRALFQDRFTQVLARSKRSDNLVAMLSVSVEMVKRIRETMGPRYSDKLKTECGKRLTELFRLEDTVAMLKDLASESSVSALNDTEFGVLVTDLKQIDHVSWIVKRVLDSFEKPFVIDNNEIFAGVNIGISIFPHDGETADELQKNASAASHHASAEQGRNKYRFYSKEINEASFRHLQIENNLRRAIENEELLLYYQPKIDVATGRVSGMEALVRWACPQIGFVHPGEFIPIAELTGQIEKIGEWVFSSACRQLHLWRDMGFEDFTMAVNFSALQFHQNNLVERMLKLINEYAISPHSIEIELTESAMIQGNSNAIKNLTELRQHGFSLALDDFGTGYSSLSYLKDIPLSCIKIDGSFVKNVESEENCAALLLSIIKMAHGLGLEVVAEGVEEQAQADILTKFGCDKLQGYLFSKPLPESEATGFLKKGPVFSLAQN